MSACQSIIKKKTAALLLLQILLQIFSTNDTSSFTTAHLSPHARLPLVQKELLRPYNTAWPCVCVYVCVCVCVCGCKLYIYICLVGGVDGGVGAGLGLADSQVTMRFQAMKSCCP
jgi:hypothetical protein